MKSLLEGISGILTTEQKAQLFPIARDWVDNDMITLEAPDFLDFGERPDIKS
jgi:hypothetical protein